MPEKSEKRTKKRRANSSRFIKLPTPFPHRAVRLGISINSHSQSAQCKSPQEFPPFSPPSWIGRQEFYIPSCGKVKFLSGSGIHSFIDHRANGTVKCSQVFLVSFSISATCFHSTYRSARVTVTPIPLYGRNGTRIVD